MFLSKDERALVLIWRIEVIRSRTLLGYYNDYSVGETKIKKIKRKLIKMGYNENAQIKIN